MSDKADATNTVMNRVITNLRGNMGDTIFNALNDPATVELMVNPDGNIYQECLGEGMKPIGYIRPSNAEAIIKIVAGTLGKEVTRFNPTLEGEFPLDGSRFAGQLPPVVTSPAFAIRKRAIAVFSLAQYVSEGVMTSSQHDALNIAIEAHRNILVIGGTGSGKTTLVNAIIAEMVNVNPDERVIIIEDTGEIQCKAKNFVQYHTSHDTSMTVLLRTILRMRPDRVFVGEVRGPEALDLLDAWNTGHPGGAATLHANNAMSGLTRLHSLITRNEFAPSHIEPLIAEAVNVVVYIERTASGRCVKEVMEIKGYENGKYITEII